MGLFRDDEAIMKQMEQNMVKNPNWQEVNQWAVLQAWTRIWTRDYREQIQLVVRARLELGASELQVQRSNLSATLPFLSVYFGVVSNTRKTKRELGVKWAHHHPRVYESHYYFELPK